MRKPSVTEKILELCGLYIQRIEANLREEKPKRAVYWATMLHSLFILSSSMAADRQMNKEVFSEINRFHNRALRILKSIGPLRPSMGVQGHGNEGLGYVLDAYDQFRQEAEMMGLL